MMRRRSFRREPKAEPSCWEKTPTTWRMTWSHEGWKRNTRWPRWQTSSPSSPRPIDGCCFREECDRCTSSATECRSSRRPHRSRTVTHSSSLVPFTDSTIPMQTRSAIFARHNGLGYIRRRGPYSLWLGTERNCCEVRLPIPRSEFWVRRKTYVRYTREHEYLSCPRASPRVCLLKLTRPPVLGCRWSCLP